MAGLLESGKAAQRRSAISPNFSDNRQIFTIEKYNRLLNARTQARVWLGYLCGLGILGVDNIRAERAADFHDRSTSSRDRNSAAPRKALADRGGTMLPAASILWRYGQISTLPDQFDAWTRIQIIERASGGAGTASWRNFWRSSRINGRCNRRQSWPVTVS